LSVSAGLRQDLVVHQFAALHVKSSNASRSSITHGTALYICVVSGDL